ncbi:MAG: DNA-binding MarR family transcriptional regulator [Candidatus Krumholzibacteriia bacterium]|jgi:DNA-binding MarR family transcriptional regulator
MKENKDRPDGVVELARFWPYQLTVLADRIARRTSRIVRDEGGINLSQWRVLAAIAEEPGRTSADVEQVTPMDKGMVSRSIKGLLNLGLVWREASQDDGRISHLQLTSDGRSLYRKLMPRVAEVLAWAETSMSSAELSILSENLRRLMSVIPR